MNRLCGFWPFRVKPRARRGHGRPVIIGERQVDLQGQRVTYILKRSSRARRVRLEVPEGTGLVVVVPRSYRLGDLDSLLRDKQTWILRNLARCAGAAPPLATAEIRDGDVVPYLGRDLHIIDCTAVDCPPEVNLTPNGLLISGASDGRGMGSLVEQWYRSEALHLVRHKVDSLTARLGLSYNRITIRGQRTRWGSCSQKGTLSFNWRLIMTPEPVLDYVIVHEVTHLREMNHTDRFWRLVAEECPRWRDHRRWLGEHGAWLTSTGRAA